MTHLVLVVALILASFFEKDAPLPSSSPLLLIIRPKRLRKCVLRGQVPALVQERARIVVNYFAIALGFG